MIENKKILIVGGTGSLGYELNKRYLDNNIIFNYSRDECKQWKMKLDFNNHKNINFIVGNMSDKISINNTFILVKPDIVIIAAAMKHVDVCELNTYESIKTNIIGPQNVLSVIHDNLHFLSNLETVLFISTDKACSPINNYGMCKAICETMIKEKAFYIPSIKFICVRYGNVLNSRGSIIPLLHEIGNDTSKSSFNLTNELMTRFIMTLSQSVDLINYALIYGSSGDIVIPKLNSMFINDIMELFSEKYHKPILIKGLRPGEKLFESLINETQSLRTIEKDGYFIIKSELTFSDRIDISKSIDYNSNSNIISKDTLKEILIENSLFD